MFLRLRRVSITWLSALADVANQAAPRLQRDHLTYGVYVQMMMWGWFLLAFGPSVPLITEQFGVSKGVGGLHGTAMALGAVLIGLTLSRLVQRFGRKLLMAAGAATVIAGVVLLTLGGHIAATLLGALIVAIGGNLMVNTAQPALSLHHGPAGTAAVTEANAACSVIGLLGPLAVGFTVASGWGWQPALAITAVFALLSIAVIAPLPGTGVMSGREVTPTAPRPAVAREADTLVLNRRGTGYTRGFWLFMVALTVGIAVEFATTFWAADLIRSRTDAGASSSTAAIAALAGGMAVARIVGGQLSLRHSAERLLLIAFAISGAGWLVMWTAQATAQAIVALAITGLGFGLLYPLGVSLVMRASAGRPDRALGISALGAGAAIGLAPLFLGALADLIGSHRAFITVPVLLVVGALSVYFGRRSERRQSVTAGASAESSA